jgi:hypothetical protein
MSIDTERRADGRTALSQLRSQLNQHQLATLSELEHFGWELKFIRRKPFQPPTPVVLDSDRKRFGVLDEDGSLNMQPGFEIRG